MAENCEFNDATPYLERQVTSEIAQASKVRRNASALAETAFRF